MKRFVLVAGLMLLANLAHAEVAATNQSTPVYQRAGEASRVILTVKSNQQVTILAEDGRWVKVRVKGRTGYVPRSTLDLADDEEVQRNTRRRPFVDGRSKKRTFGGEGPDDRVGADSVDTSDDDDGASAGKRRASRRADDEDGRAGDDDEGDAAPRKRRPPRDGDADAPGEDEDNPVATSTSSDDDKRAAVSVTERVVLRANPSRKSAKIMTAHVGDKFYLVEKRGGWALVETEDGDKSGWVLQRLLEGDGIVGKRQRRLDVSAQLALTVISQNLSSTGTTAKFPDNYSISTSAAALALSGEWLMPFKADFYLGAQLTYIGTKALPGLSYMGTNIPITMHNLNVRGEFGYDFHKPSGMLLLGRLGYHYDAYLMPVDNKATLPSESLAGPTLGVALDVPRLRPSISVRGALDAIVLAKRGQTVGLEDGASPSAIGLSLGGVATWKWKPALWVVASYELQYYSNSFGAAVATSKRMHTGTSVARSDMYHVIGVGVRKPL